MLKTMLPSLPRGVNIQSTTKKHIRKNKQKQLVTTLKTILSPLLQTVIIRNY